MNTFQKIIIFGVIAIIVTLFFLYYFHAEIYLSRDGHDLCRIGDSQEKCIEETLDIYERINRKTELMKEFPTLNWVSYRDLENFCEDYLKMDYDTMNLCMNSNAERFSKNP